MKMSQYRKIFQRRGRHFRRLQNRSFKRRGGNPITAILDSLNHQFNPYGVQILAVAVQSAHLPDNLSKLMQDATYQDILIAEQRMRYNMEMMLVKQTDEMLETKQRHKNDEAKETRLGRQEAEEIERKLRKVQVDTERIRRKVEAGGG